MRIKMTTETRLYMKANWMTFANLIMLIGLIIKLSMWMQSTNDQIELLNLHKNNTSIHTPFEKKILLFVPRIELESKFDNITNQLDRIEKKLDEKH